MDWFVGRIEVLADPPALARRAAEWMTATALAARGPFRIALSGETGWTGIVSLLSMLSPGRWFDMGCRCRPGSFLRCTGRRAGQNINHRANPIQPGSVADRARRRRRSGSDPPLPWRGASLGALRLVRH